METKPNNIYQKIDDVKANIGKLSKDLDNPFFKSKYFDINQIIDQAEPLLRENGLMLLQPIINGCVVSQIIELETGVMIESSIKVPELTDPQKVGSAITYYRRYTLQSLLALQAEDDDANKAAGNIKKTDSAKPGAKAWLNPGSEKWAEAVKFLAGEGTIEQIKKKYNLSKENETKLKESALEAA